MNHHLKLNARSFGILETTIDTMYDHPDGEAINPNKRTP